ncbi:MAG TPA: hypothetical protein VEJ86_11820 [Candidatus Binataceae bacterium]|nr:hypothetical protein [Candidatus Binataceae bacterium]
MLLKALVTLVVAALLEVGGDAVIRMGLSGPRLLIAAGGLVLFAYGVLVNKSGIDFNRMMGVYIAVFFLVSQLIAWIVFKQVPDDRLLVGGGFIVAGGLLILVMT